MLKTHKYFQNQPITGQCMFFLLTTRIHPHCPNQYLHIYRYVSILLVGNCLSPSEGGDSKHQLNTLERSTLCLMCFLEIDTVNFIPLIFKCFSQ